MKLFSCRHAAIIAAGSLAVLVSVAAIAQAATDTIYRYSTPKVGSFSIDHMAMAPLINTIEYTNSTFGLDTTDEGCFATGVNLPHGATITKLIVYYGSDATPADPTFLTLLFRQQLDNGIRPAIAVAELPTTNNTRKARVVPLDTTSPANLIINNHQYAYNLAICLGPTDLFFGSRITYTYTNAGD